ncbi:MAG TPA: hypothetical protein DCL44_06545 [Elusimicrobia bacterium]|nr:hypothetical protein [Elusimicrobiota bacterium]
MKIGIITRAHITGKQSPLMPAVARLLRKYGASVEIIYPEDRLKHLRQIHPTYDLYILKDTSPMGLGFGGALYSAGAKIINPYPASAILRDKIAATSILKSARLPVPDTYVVKEIRQLAPLLGSGPLIIKPYRGSRGAGIKVVRNTRELAQLPVCQDPVFAQRYHKPDGPDHKLYSIGGQVFGVLRSWPARTYKEKLGCPFPVTPALRDLALRCGKAFGVGIFGVDVVMSHGLPYIVDMQNFPGFKGVPNAALKLADYIYRIARSISHKNES